MKPNLDIGEIGLIIAKHEYTTFNIFWKVIKIDRFHILKT